MRRLKIVHLIDLAKVGGVESMFADFIQATPPSGLEVEHYTIVDNPELAPRFRDSVAKHSRLLASPKTLGPFKLPRRPYWMRARRRLALIRRCRPDLVIAWNQFTDFRVAALKLGCPLIYYEHGMSWYDHSPRQLAGFLPYVTGVIAVSQAARRMLELKHHLQVPIDVCLNPLPTHLLPPATAAGRTLPTNRPLRLGMAARLVPLKAVGLLILTVKKLREQGVQVEAWIAGEGPERPVLVRLIQQHDLADSVRLLGLVDDMPAFYQNIDLFVMTSMHESLSLVCLEAMAWGLPVIAQCVDGIVEVVPNGQAGMLLPATLTIAEYAALTGASTAFARQVYDPLRDQLVVSQLLSPDDMADAVVRYRENTDLYMLHSKSALSLSKKWPGHSDFIGCVYTSLLRYL